MKPQYDLYPCIDSGNGLTFEQLEEAIKLLPEAPAFSKLQFIENTILPDNTVMVSSKIMNLLKKVFNEKTNQ